jgi:hypothetical protein
MRPGSRASAEPAPRRIASSDNAFLAELEAVRGRLAERGAAPAVLAHVEDVLVAQHQRYHAWMAAEADKRRTLLGLVRSLEARRGARAGTACERAPPALPACRVTDRDSGSRRGWRQRARARVNSPADFGERRAREQQRRMSGFPPCWSVMAPSRGLRFGAQEVTPSGRPACPTPGPLAE